MLQRLTNHELKSTTHRVVNPPKEKWGQPRFSMPFFCHPVPDMSLAALPQCVAEGEIPADPPTTAGEYLAERLQEIGLTQKSNPRGLSNLLAKRSVRFAKRSVDLLAKSKQNNTPHDNNTADTFHFAGPRDFAAGLLAGGWFAPTPPNGNDIHNASFAHFTPPTPQSPDIFQLPLPPIQGLKKHFFVEAAEASVHAVVHVQTSSLVPDASTLGSPCWAWRRDVWRGVLAVAL